MNALIIHLAPKMPGISRLAGNCYLFQERLCYMERVSRCETADARNSLGVVDVDALPACTRAVDDRR